MKKKYLLNCSLLVYDMFSNCLFRIEYKKGAFGGKNLLGYTMYPI
jgi:hypothetical protein